MQRLKIIAIAAACLAVMASSCKKEPSSQHSIQIATLTFRTSTTAPDISSTSFTVDTLNYLVYNSDSLLYSSKLTKVLPVITCYSSPSTIAINGVAWNQTDTLDLSAGTAQITIVGSDEVTSCTYTLNINKHKVNPDSIVWTKISDSYIDLSGASDIYGMPVDSDFYAAVSLTAGGGSMYSTRDGSNWNKLADYSTEINIRTMNTALLYGDNGSLYQRLYAIGSGSTPSLYYWDKAGAKWIELISQVENYVFKEVMGSADTTLTLLTQDSGTGLLYLAKINPNLAEPEFYVDSQPTYDKLPVSGAAKLSRNGVPYLIGGYDATSALLGSVYSRNGGDWTDIVTPKHQYPFGRRARAAVFYVEGATFLLGGATEGSTAIDLYYSYDSGFNWTAGTTAQKTFGEYNAVSGSTAFVTGNNIWVIGGFDASGKLNAALWKGRMNKSDFIKR